MSTMNITFVAAGIAWLFGVSPVLARRSPHRTPILLGGCILVTVVLAATYVIAVVTA